MADRVIKVGLLGLGTVGSSLVRLLEANAQEVWRRTGVLPLVTTALVRDPAKPRNLGSWRGTLTTDPEEVLSSDVDVVVEAMGGVEPATQYLLRALERGKHVLTANKELVAGSGPKLLAAAERPRRMFLFEASVAGGVPVIGPLTTSLAANRVSLVEGILNGTTNFILDAMREGASFESALAEARRRGYAEADPTEDIKGFDAARKLAILASLAFDRPVPVAWVKTRGIEEVTPEDHQNAARLGAVIKLLARASSEGGRLELSVVPTLIAADHPLAAVRGADNAVRVKADQVGEVVFSGPGAGGPATASALAGDLVAVARGAGALQIPAWKVPTIHESPAPAFDYRGRYYLRLRIEPDRLREEGLVLARSWRRQAGFGAVVGPVGERELRRALRRLGHAYTYFPLREDD